MTPRASTARLLTALAAVLALSSTACDAAQQGLSRAADPASSTGSASGGSAAGAAITVLAASSLTGSFTELGRDFEAAHPGSRVTFSFGSSSTLATQITLGAPADVFAAASQDTMKPVTDAGAAADPEPFASNTLEIAVPKTNPGHVRGLGDFADEAKKIAICAPQVPCGAAATKVFAAAQVVARPDTLESDVKAALQKVALGEVDAALVYRTDVLAAGDRVTGVPFRESGSAVNVYPIATLRASRQRATAQSFVSYVLSPAGRAVLIRAGFGTP